MCSFVWHLHSDANIKTCSFACSLFVMLLKRSKRSCCAFSLLLTNTTPVCPSWVLLANNLRFAYYYYSLSQIGSMTPAAFCDAHTKFVGLSVDTRQMLKQAVTFDLVQMLERVLFAQFSSHPTHKVKTDIFSFTSVCNALSAHVLNDCVMCV